MKIKRLVQIINIGLAGICLFAWSADQKKSSYLHVADILFGKRKISKDAGIQSPVYTFDKSPLGKLQASIEAKKLARVREQLSLELKQPKQNLPTVSKISLEQGDFRAHLFPSDVPPVVSCIPQSGNQDCSDDSDLGLPHLKLEFERSPYDSYKPNIYKTYSPFYSFRDAQYEQTPQRSMLVDSIENKQIKAYETKALISSVEEVKRLMLAPTPIGMDPEELIAAENKALDTEFTLNHYLYSEGRFEGPMPFKLTLMRHIKHALDLGTYPDVQSIHGLPLLAGSGPRLTKLLLNNGADPFAQDFFALREAVYKLKSPQVRDILLEHMEKLVKTEPRSKRNEEKLQQAKQFVASHPLALWF